MSGMLIHEFHPTLSPRSPPYASKEATATLGNEGRPPTKGQMKIIKLYHPFPGVALVRPILLGCYLCPILITAAPWNYSIGSMSLALVPDENWPK